MKATKLELLTVVLWGIFSMLFCAVDLLMDVPYSGGINLIYALFVLGSLGLTGVLIPKQKEDVETQ